MCASSSLKLAQSSPAFSVIQIQVTDYYAYLVIRNVGGRDAHNVRIRCELELTEDNIEGETFFPLPTWRTSETRRFAVRFKTNVWHRYYDTSPLKITITSDDTAVQLRLD